jgi:hypothetical protein
VPSRLTNREHLLRSVPESDVQATLTEALEAFGYLWHHETDSRRSNAGLPDIIAVHYVTGALGFIECKTEVGRLRADQVAWRDALRRVQGISYSVARPSTLDAIVERLAREADR